MVGGEVFGFIGLVFAVPLTCAVKALIKVAWDWYTSERYLDDHSIEATVAPYT